MMDGNLDPSTFEALSKNTLVYINFLSNYLHTNNKKATECAGQRKRVVWCVIAFANKSSFIIFTKLSL